MGLLGSGNRIYDQKAGPSIEFPVIGHKRSRSLVHFWEGEGLGSIHVTAEEGSKAELFIPLTSILGEALKKKIRGGGDAHMHFGRIGDGG